MDHPPIQLGRNRKKRNLTRKADHPLVLLLGGLPRSPLCQNEAQKKAARWRVIPCGLAEEETRVIYIGTPLRWPQSDLLQSPRLTTDVSEFFCGSTPSC
jgi:hypothetical protein